MSSALIEACVEPTRGRLQVPWCGNRNLPVRPWSSLFSFPNFFPKNNFTHTRREFQTGFLLPVFEGWTLEWQMQTAERFSIPRCNK